MYEPRNIQDASMRHRVARQSRRESERGREAGIVERLCTYVFVDAMTLCRLFTGPTIVVGLRFPGRCSHSQSSTAHRGAPGLLGHLQPPHCAKAGPPPLKLAGVLEPGPEGRGSDWNRYLILPSSLKAVAIATCILGCWATGLLGFQGPWKSGWKPV